MDAREGSGGGGLHGDSGPDAVDDESRSWSTKADDGDDWSMKAVDGSHHHYHVSDWGEKTPNHLWGIDEEVSDSEEDVSDSEEDVFVFEEDVPIPLRKMFKRSGAVFTCLCFIASFTFAYVQTQSSLPLEETSFWVFVPLDLAVIFLIATFYFGMFVVLYSLCHSGGNPDRPPPGLRDMASAALASTVGLVSLWSFAAMADIQIWGTPVTEPLVPGLAFGQMLVIFGLTKFSMALLVMYDPQKWTVPAWGILVGGFYSLAVGMAIFMHTLNRREHPDILIAMVSAVGDYFVTYASIWLSVVLSECWRHPQTDPEQPLLHYRRKSERSISKSEESVCNRSNS